MAPLGAKVTPLEHTSPLEEGKELFLAVILALLVPCEENLRPLAGRDSLHQKIHVATSELLLCTVDRDECLEETALCSQKCFNTFGSYRCGCNEGYALYSDQRTCTGIITESSNSFFL